MGSALAKPPDPTARPARAPGPAPRRAGVQRAAPRAKTQAPPPAAVDPATRVLRRFRLVFNAVKSHFQQVEKQAGVGGAQLWALSVVAQQPGIGVGDLARAMDIHQTTASNLVKALLAQQMITLARSAADRRVAELRVLPAGQRVLKKAPGPFAGVLPQALARLDEATLQRLDADLGTLISALDADERAAGIPLAQM
ncbi:MAG: winged helix-turn-helix transcriptional regulator [Rubrivivax sp.]|nr:winged helix-turn-helix transcriptional regulator [Rubrivivax sp.]